MITHVLVQQLMKGRYCSFPEGQKPSKDCQNFLHGILAAVNPANRPSLAEVREHPWFKSGLSDHIKVRQIPSICRARGVITAIVPDVLSPAVPVHNPLQHERLLADSPLDSAIVAPLIGAAMRERLFIGIAQLLW